MTTDTWTLRRLLEWTQKFLQEKGIETPRLDAEILLAHALGCKRIDLYVRSEEEPSEDVRTAFKSLIRKRVEGCPVAYLVGHREFYQLPFEVTPAVLIPRPETEHLVMEALRLMKGLSAPRVLDIGTGSGCIAISIAHQHKGAELTVIDLSEAALAVARRNAARHGLTERVRFLHGDLLAPLERGELFDIIVSNPPYISESEFAALAADVRDYEPPTALLAGPEGLDVYRRLSAGVADFVRAGGYLLLEIGSSQAQAVRALFDGHLAFDDIQILPDLAGHPRVLLARRK